MSPAQSRRARRPKHPEQYVPAHLAARGLRQLADQLEHREAACLVSWHLNLSYWYFDDGAPTVGVERGAASPAAAPQEESK